jgi:hypothetical protein
MGGQEKKMSIEVAIEEMAPQFALEIESEISLFKIARTLSDSFGMINHLIRKLLAKRCHPREG